MSVSARPIDGLPDRSTNPQSEDASLPTEDNYKKPAVQALSSGLDRMADFEDSAEEPLPPNSTIGQFSLAPATRTTVVTTTTTTTTNFPPFVMRAPRSNKTLDPKVYPLSAAPTPASLKDIRFNLGGESIVFNEADDALKVFNELKEQRHALNASNGVVRSIATYDSNDDVVNRRSSPRRASQRVASMPTPNINRRRPVSPMSLPESSHTASQRYLAGDTTSNLISRRPSSQFRLDCPKNSSGEKEVGLATPETESGSFTLGHDRTRRKRTRNTSRLYPGNAFSSSLSGQDPIPQASKGDIEMSSGERSPLLERRTGLNPEQFVSQSLNTNDTCPSDTSNRPQLPLPHGADPANISLSSNLRRSRLPELESVATQDLCLPSPSLSPVAAMNAQNLDTSFDSTEDQGVDTDSSLDHRPKQVDKSPCPVHTTSGLPLAGVAGSTPDLSLMDMPKVVGFFESVPDELKSYLVFQLLKSCPKRTLQFVAGVVNPALKCDFLARLPLEISLEVVKYFDYKTMCRASQVSKRWRHIINSDEKTWKELLTQDGYVLPEGELQRAIEEGWGWQFPDGSEGCERDLRLSAPRIPNNSLQYPSDSSNTIQQDQLSVPAGSRRLLKRKASTRLSGRKLAKRRSLPSHSSTQVASSSRSSAWLDNLSIAESPYAAANAAALAVPYADVGLPSLKSLHLYKSLYQRHHIIHQSWMRDDVKPMHLAFRAHDRHVVTCLQFDTDKILTGSDDTNINVYDTKTGALRATMEGHEGGVWALAYYGNTLVSGSTDRSVRVWDIESAECTHVFQGHTSTVRCLQILLPAEVGKLPDGTPEMMPKEPLIITGSRDANLRVWKMPKPGEPRYYQAGPAQNDNDCPYFIRTLSGHGHSVRALAAHGDTIVSGSYDCTVRVWRISTGEAVHRLSGHSLKVYSVVLDHKRNRCISGSMDNMVKIWSLETGSLLFNLEGHQSLVGLLDLQADILVSAAADSSLRVWDPDNGQMKSVLTGHTGAITCFQHDGQKVISGSDRTLKMWNLRTGKCIKDLLTDLSGVWQVSFNDRRCVAAVQRDRLTYIEVIDFGASRDRVPAHNLGKRIVVDRNGHEIPEGEDGNPIDADGLEQ